MPEPGAVREPHKASVVVEAWRRSYNTQRPHSSLGYKTPREVRDDHERGGARSTEE